jgi:hypothetical protein
VLVVLRALLSPYDRRPDPHARTLLAFRPCRPITAPVDEQQLGNIYANNPKKGGPG